MGCCFSELSCCRCDDKDNRNLPTATEVRALLPLIECRFKGTTAIPKSPLARMKRVFGSCQEEYEMGILRDHAKLNTNTPIVMDTDTLGGLYWPGLNTTPWKTASSLEWTHKLSGTAVIRPILKEIERIKRASERVSSKDTASLELDKSCRESKTATLKPYDESDSYSSLVRRNDRRYDQSKWKALFLVDSGHVNEEIWNQCPALAQLVSQIPRRCGDVFISAISPGTKIRLHRGPTNTKLTCHLGLFIPSGDCGLKVGSTSAKWKVGEWLVFNDSYPHEAWNFSSQVRYVLIVDVWCPGLTNAETRALEILRDEKGALLRQLHGPSCCSLFRASCNGCSEEEHEDDSSSSEEEEEDEVVESKNAKESEPAKRNPESELVCGVVSIDSSTKSKNAS